MVSIPRTGPGPQLTPHPEPVVTPPRNGPGPQLYPQDQRHFGRTSAPASGPTPGERHFGAAAPRVVSQTAGERHFGVHDARTFTAPTRSADGRVYIYHGASFSPFRVRPYHWAPGYAYARYGPGEHLPPVFWASQHVILDYLDYALAPPAGDQEWVRFGPDLLLVDTSSGQVVDAVYGAFEEAPDADAAPGDLPPDAGDPGPPAGPQASIPNQVITAGYNGQQYVTGSFTRQGSSTTWIEQNSQGANSFGSSSESPDDIILFDTSRNMYIDLRLSDKSVYFRNADDQNWHHLYTITGIQ